MARIRTIKPEFFTSEDIVKLPPLARLLYIALWCEADREGRMLWKPLTFKMRYFPVEECDIEALCKELTAAGLVRLYGDGLAYIPAFAKHQHINPRESVSNLPDPDAPVTRGRRVSTRASTVSDAQVGRERKGKEGNVLVEPNGSTCPPDPESGQSDVYEVPDCPASEVIALYHEQCPTLARVEVLNDFRRGLIRQRWREVCADQKYGHDEAIAWWRDYFASVAQSPFLTGKSRAKPGDAPFQADFEWLVRPQNFAKVVEGRYHRRIA